MSKLTLQEAGELVHDVLLKLKEADIHYIALMNTYRNDGDPTGMHVGINGAISDIIPRLTHTLANIMTEHDSSVLRKGMKAMILKLATDFKNDTEFRALAVLMEESGMDGTIDVLESLATTTATTTSVKEPELVVDNTKKPVTH